MTLLIRSGEQRQKACTGFGWNMRKYANDVKAKEATPIILSLTARNNWKEGIVVRARPNGYAEWAQQYRERKNAVEAGAPESAQTAEPPCTLATAPP